MRSEVRATWPPPSLATPSGRYCASWCPQRGGTSPRTGLGRCRLLGYEVRAEPDEWTVQNTRRLGHEPPAAEPCPVLAIRLACILADIVLEAKADGTRVPVRCGLCGGFVEYPMDWDALRCAECGAEAPVVCTTGFDRDWKRPEDPYRLPDLTPWAEDAVSAICAFGRQCGHGVVREVRSDSDGIMHAVFNSGHRDPEGDGYAFRYPLANQTREQVDAGRRHVVEVLRQRRLM